MEKMREKEIIRAKLVGVSKRGLCFMESFQSEINYLTSKELIQLQNEDKSNDDEEEYLMSVQCNKIDSCEIINPK